MSEVQEPTLHSLLTRADAAIATARRLVRERRRLAHELQLRRRELAQHKADR
jgi:hypothetical protein